MQASTIKSYLYKQYQDDLDLQAFVDAYNAMTQEYVDWFNTMNLPIYTGLTGLWLDWIADGIYGQERPTISLASGAVYGFAVYGVDSYGAGSSISVAVTDDIYKRILTWKLYRGDGFTMSIPWLKKRLKRFLIGANGAAVAIDSTPEISIMMKPGNVISVGIHYPADPASVLLLIEALNAKVLDIPWQYTVTAAAI